jgi:hypothetical protein
MSLSGGKTLTTTNQNEVRERMSVIYGWDGLNVA